MLHHRINTDTDGCGNTDLWWVAEPWKKNLQWMDWWMVIANVGPYCINYKSLLSPWGQRGFKHKQKTHSRGFKKSSKQLSNESLMKMHWTKGSDRSANTPVYNLKVDLHILIPYEASCYHLSVLFFLRKTNQKARWCKCASLEQKIMKGVTEFLCTRQ